MASGQAMEWVEDIVERRRQRSAVLFADLVESVRLYSQHEASVIERWQAYVQQVRHDIAKASGGRLVRTTGDGLLLEFPLADQAVTAAFALHAALPRFNLGLPDSARFWLRIGVHLAEVVAAPQELYGAGVNVAARLASLAQPGQTLATAQFRHELADGALAVVQDLGLRFVKHMDDPLRVFLLHPPGAVQSLKAPDAAADLRPTIAVLPFAAVPDDDTHAALGHALAEDVIASLARHPALRVISRASTALLRSVPESSASLKSLLGASFLLTGQYLVRDGRARLGFELSEIESGTVLWTGRSMGDVEALFEGTDELVPQVVGEVSRQIIGHELARARSLPVDTLSSYTLYLGAGGLISSLTRSDFACARTILEHLIERHPRQAAPVALLARWHVLALEQQWSDGRDTLQAKELCERALDRDPDSALAHATLAQVSMNFLGQPQAGRDLSQRAISLDPADPWAWSQLSGALTFLGDPESACAAAEECLRLSPVDPSRYVFEAYAAMAYLAAGKPAQATLHASQSVRQHSLHAPSLHLLVGAQWLNGEREAARDTALRYLGLFPATRAGVTAERRLGHGQTWRADFEQALVGAGIPP